MRLLIGSRNGCRYAEAESAADPLEAPLLPSALPPPGEGAGVRVRLRPKSMCQPIGDLSPCLKPFTEPREPLLQSNSRPTPTLTPTRTPDPACCAAAFADARSDGSPAQLLTPKGEGP